MECGKHGAGTVGGRLEHCPIKVAAGVAEGEPGDHPAGVSVVQRGPLTRKIREHDQPARPGRGRGRLLDELLERPPVGEVTADPLGERP
jgi:hypothetical protein